MPATPSPLARRYRRLMLTYPRAYRRERGEELLATLLELAAPDRARPTLREAANLIGHGLRARLGRPASRTVVTWSVLTALVCGLYVAAMATRLAWETSRPHPDQAETVAVLAEILPGHQVDGIQPAQALFTFYTEPFGPQMLDSLMFGDGNEYALGTTTASRDGIPPEPLEQVAAGAERRLRAGGWTVYPVTHNDTYSCIGPPCDPATIPRDTRLFAERGDTVFELELVPSRNTDSIYLGLSLSRATPAAVPPAGVAGGLAGAAVGWLLFAWASRRTQDRHAVRGTVTVLYAVTMLFWWGPILPSVPAAVTHHLDEPHPRWHPLWEWLGQPTFSLLFVAGCAAALLGLCLAALPSRRRQPVVSHVPGVEAR
ncbi:hypothetical protein [Catellatospora methionotrophica]|uniref:hypothetical protein n=1 Tax=Catellatospora methionotrophica TaxID=121620 RepID=UPI00340A8B1E